MKKGIGGGGGGIESDKVAGVVSVISYFRDVISTMPTFAGCAVLTRDVPRGVS